MIVSLTTLLYVPVSMYLMGMIDRVWATDSGFER